MKNNKREQIKKFRRVMEEKNNKEKVEIEMFMRFLSLGEWNVGDVIPPSIIVFH
jgi:hypothetical protein